MITGTDIRCPISSVNMSETSSTIGDSKSIQHSKCMDATWAATKVMQLCELIFLLILLLPVANAAAAPHVSFLVSDIGNFLCIRS